MSARYRAIVDTGFLVALVDADDRHHDWAVEVTAALRGPWCTAEACISEAVFVLEPTGRAAVEAVFAWLAAGALVSRHLLPDELVPVRRELLAYTDRWVDFADACIVRLSDLDPTMPVVTIDVKDFAVYFRQRRGRRLITPMRR